MSLAISSIKDVGVASKERVVLRAESDCDVGNYFVMRTGLREGQPTSLVHDTFWVPDLRVSKGDYLVLYTKSGEPKAKSNKDGSTTHFYYLHKPDAIFGNRDSCVLLVEAERWKAKTPDGF